MTSTSQQPVNSPQTSKDDTAFPPDSYTVQLGDSFTSRPSKRTPSYYSFKCTITSSPLPMPNSTCSFSSCSLVNSGGDDRSTSNRKVSLSKVNDDSYTVEYAPLEVRCLLCMLSFYILTCSRMPKTIPKWRLTLYPAVFKNSIVCLFLMKRPRQVVLIWLGIQLLLTKASRPSRLNAP